MRRPSQAPTMIHTRVSRRFLLRCIGALAVCLVGGASRAAAQSLTSTLVASGFQSPVYVCSSPGDTQRLFVVEQGGAIWIVKNGATLAVPFLDLGAIVLSGGEQGLLGMAFHPSYASNGRFYVSYTDSNGSSVIRQYHVSANSDVADSANFITIFGPYPHPQANHNGGNLQFGPDGKLYFGLGDGGNFNDVGPGHAPEGNAQSPATYLGKLLRFDVDVPPPYVPADNPFVDPNDGVLDLIWAFGLRNPWRFSFDRATGELYIADVGQASWEEIDFQGASSAGGENYGWRCMEAGHCTGSTGCTCFASTLVQPIQEYGHTEGCAIVGGYVYRGAALPFLRGTYLYADVCSGRIWSFRYPNGVVEDFRERTVELGGGGVSIGNPVSFGEDANGELYVVDQVGYIFRIDYSCPAPVNYCTGAPNSVGAGARIDWRGTTSVSQNQLSLVVSGCPPSTIGLMIFGSSPTQSFFGNGFLCVGAPLHRLGIVHADTTGIVRRSFDATAHGIAPGDVRFFQLWYRNPAGGGVAFNLSDGLAVTFCD